MGMGWAGGNIDRADGARQGGFALLDVVIASVVLMVILVPVATLLTTTVKMVGTAQGKTQAQTLAVETMNQYVSATIHSGSLPAGLSDSWTADPSNPYFVDGKPIYLFEAGGWCVAGSTSSNQYANGTVSTSPNNQPTYVIVVKAQWGSGASSATGAAHSVLTDGAMTVTPVILGTYASSGTVLSHCPVGLS